MEIEKNQKKLRENIEESKQLVEKTQEILKKVRPKDWRDIRESAQAVPAPFT